MRACLILILLWSLPGWADDEPVSVTGHPHMVRTNARTDVFFSDLNNSYSIPQDSRHNAMLTTFEEAAKKGQAVSFMADPKSRFITEISATRAGAATMKPAAGAETAVPVPAAKDPFDQSIPLTSEGTK